MPLKYIYKDIVSYFININKMEQNKLILTSRNLEIPRVKLLLYYSKKNSVREVLVDRNLVSIDSLN